MRFYDMLGMVVDDPQKAEAIIRSDPQLLLRNEPGETMLHSCAIENDLSRVTGLHRLGASLDTCDCYGATPLIHAVQLDYRELAEYLLVQGADVDAKTVNRERLCPTRF